MMQHFFPAERGVFQDDIALADRVLVTGWFEEHEDEITHLP